MMLFYVMPAPHDHELLLFRLRRCLTAQGPSRGSDLYAALGVSQPTLSRLLKGLHQEILVTGRGKTTRYAWRREIPQVVTPIPVFEVARPGALALHRATLHPIQPDGFFVEFHDGGRDAFYPDLPYFLQDLRPSGFLGRLTAHQDPTLGLPSNILLWSGEHVLRYITRYGWNLSGSWIVGAEPYERFLNHTLEPPDLVDAPDRERRYPDLAAEVLRLGPPGSSAAGEQPKFLATRRAGDALTPVLVKFSAPADNPANQRVADLLIAEHVALQTLRAQGIPAAISALIFAKERTFLEVERFDRAGVAHRSGLLSLWALDAEFVERADRTWSASVEALVEKGVVPVEILEQVHRLELFGQLIGNTDMHFGNLSFCTEGTQVVALAPAYDMSPALYVPRFGEVVPREFRVTSPRAALGTAAAHAIEAALLFWQRVAEHPRVSAGFREIASSNHAEVARLRGVSALLPRQSRMGR